MINTFASKSKIRILITTGEKVKKKYNNNKRAVLFVWKSRISKIRHCVTVFTPTYSSAYNYF